MTSHRLVVVLTLVNAALFLGTLAGEPRPAAAASPDTVLRGRALEIVDGEGRVRASISVEPPTRVAGRDYPETVLLRLTDPTSGPVVKLVATRDGSALGLSDGGAGGVQLSARDSASFVRVTDRSGRARR